MNIICKRKDKNGKEWGIIAASGTFTICYASNNHWCITDKKFTDPAPAIKELKKIIA